ncbi:MAG: TatD family hydrolase [Dehalococcoidales bacterium]
MNTLKIHIIDTHAHLDGEEFTEDFEAMLVRAVEAGVSRIITAGTSVESSEKAIALAEKYPQIFAAVGIHPQEIYGVQKMDIRRIAELAKTAKVVAIGEMGLDFHRSAVHREEQIQGLKQQLELANELHRPVIIHNRQSTKEMIEILGEWVQKSGVKSPGVIHCFQENADNARVFLEMGFYLAFGGYIGYPKSTMAEVIKIVPENRLLVETDAPYLPPQKFRGHRNEPAYIVYTVERMAEILGLTAERAAEITTENACRLFGLK